MEKALTPTQIAILHLIAAGRSTATTIAQHLGLQRSWVQECLSKLHSQEKITRKKAKKATVGRKKLVYRLNTSWECTGCAEPTYSGRYCTSCKQVFRRDRLFLQAAIAWAEQDFLSGKAVNPASLSVKFAVPMWDSEDLEGRTNEGLVSQLLKKELLSEEWSGRAQHAKTEN